MRQLKKRLGNRPNPWCRVTQEAFEAVRKPKSGTTDEGNLAAFLFDRAFGEPVSAAADYHGLSRKEKSPFRGMGGAMPKKGEGEINGKRQKERI